MTRQSPTPRLPRSERGGTRSRRHLGAVWLLAGALAAAPAAAQTGNLAAHGRFDDSGDAAAWQVISPAYSSGSFDGADDADACILSGSLDMVADPDVDFGTAEYRLCLGAVVAGIDYSIAGDIRFPSSAHDARSNLTLSFTDGADCTGNGVGGGLFAGYAVSSTAGWQHVEAGPATPPVGAVSVMISVLLTQNVGADPAVEALADEVRVTAADWIFAEDQEIGEPCRWSSTQP